VRVLPSELAAAIDGLFGPRSHDINDGRVGPQFQADVSTIVSLLDQVPNELIDFGIVHYTELRKCRAVLVAALGCWGRGAQTPAEAVNGKDPVERVKRLMQLCHDELPPPRPELPFIGDEARRVGIENEIAAAWASFSSRTWLGATTFAGAAMEAILLWALQRSVPEKTFTKARLVDLIDAAAAASLISQETAMIAHAARDARNLVHPGKVAETGTSCSKASSLTALAGLYRVIEDLAKERSKNEPKRAI
jgi:hypothetical protein